MTSRKLLLRLAGISMTAATVVSLAGCTASGSVSAGSSGTVSSMSGPRPSPTDDGDTYELHIPHPDTDPHTVAVSINPDRRSMRAGNVHPVHLHFKTAADSGIKIVEVSTPEKKGKHVRVELSVQPDPNTTGPHPISVVIDSGN